MDNRLPNWKKWKLIPEVEIWQAVALSLDIDPDKVEFDRLSWMAGSSSPHPISEGEEFNDRLDVIRGNSSNRDYFPTPGKISIANWYRCGIHLSEFASFAANIAEWNIPEELRNLAKIPAQTNNGTIHVQPKTDMSQAKTNQDWKAEQTNELIGTHEYTSQIIGLFDPLNKDGIASMFQIQGFDWIKATERAARNGLKDARVGWGKFNPAKVASWLVKQGKISQEQANRKLAKNLPTRSKDSAYLITGEMHDFG